ncbi:hypothetical protein AB1A81_13495 [Bdellovibrio bacteriovorus]|uniref:DUF5666 domain-containing protein n=1 Tax=Bdellovibrio bacteriovorus (strain ATCC 15356 / DSM 50701 / NCIMB 9529 / HD100) TaxID=264462 RepID=Q6MJ46_BDEBA|nr:hypothetical protein [Bdellovibrio bacteriovorus]CAE80715.1 hypothetical protein predicted by Glimmer/Critica [Bdellovibrio bacteriovorus HD100]
MKNMVLLGALLLSMNAFAAKTYQVTGPIVELSDSRIIVQKGNDRWEIERNPNTKVMGDLKVGQKVTVEYTMAADSVEIKSDSKKK